jgi:serine/threonine protein kinase
MDEKPAKEKQSSDLIVDRTTSSSLDSSEIAAASGDDRMLGKCIDGRYEVISFIGEGGMGRVYKALHVGIDKIVALKTLNREHAVDDILVRRFQQEAKTASALSHPNLLTVQDFGITDGGEPYFVMEYLHGSSLSTIIKEQKPFDANRFLPIFEQLCLALAYAHEHGVIHRDIKPSNIMLMQDADGKESAKILDFGIAKFTPASAEKDTGELTRTGEIIGSPRYMSPEQGLGRKLDSRADIYSLGCVMYECITGEPPFMGDNAIETVVKHVNEQPRSLHEVKPDLRLPNGLNEVVLRCLAKAPDDRYQNFADLNADLARVGSQKGVAQTRRKPASKIWIAVASIVVAAGLGVLCFSFLREPPQTAPSVSPIAVAPSTATPPDTVPSIAEADKLVVQAYPLHDAGKADESLHLFEKAARIYEANHETSSLPYCRILKGYADGLRDVDRLPESAEMYRKAAEIAARLAPDSLVLAEIGFAYAYALEKMHQFGHAEFACQRALAIFDKSKSIPAAEREWGHLQLAGIYHQEGKNDLALAEYRSQLRSDGTFGPMPDREFALQGYGWALVDLGKRKEGYAVFDKAIAQRRARNLHPDRPFADTLRAVAGLYSADGNKAKAAALLKEAKTVELPL